MPLLSPPKFLGMIIVYNAAPFLTFVAASWGNFSSIVIQLPTMPLASEWVEGRRALKEGIPWEFSQEQK